MLALDDGALAIVLIAASRLPADADRVALLERFAATADPPRPRADQLVQMNQSSGGRAPRPRSPDAERMRRYRARLRREIAIVPTPVSAATIGYLVRHGYLRGEREAYGREEIGRAIAAALECLAR
jgi:hypothetical protein